MSFSGLLIANRGEIAIRIARAASDLGIRSVAVFSEDDAASLHTRVADEAHPLSGIGARAYLDIEAIIQAAKDTGCDAVHPGYGFLSEQAEFARRCGEQGITFVGPKVEHLSLFGDKARAREAAIKAGVPVLKGIDRAVSLEEARAFFESSGGAMIIKAIAGGGGRGTSAVTEADELEKIYERCRREANAAFGIEDVYVEEFIARARHVEVQILGDLEGGITHLWERECSVQRRNQKVLEIAPAPGLDSGLREDILAAAVRFAEHVGYSNLGTFEFLVDEAGGPQPFVFIEANARLQVEHTVTEEVTGVDIVQSQIRLAAGESLAAVGLGTAIEPRGFAIQARVNMETIKPNGQVRPASGTFTAYEAPSGPGVRTDGFGYVGYRTSTAFDSLLAKVIVHSPGPDFSQAVKRTARALTEFRIEGVGNNLSWLHNIVTHEDFVNARVYTRWVDDQMKALAEPSETARPRYVVAEKGEDAGSDGFAGARVDKNDPLALFSHDAEIKARQSSTQAAAAPHSVQGPSGSIGMSSPIQGTIISIDVTEGDEVRAGQQVAVVEAMKMEHVIASEVDGIVREITMSAGDVVREKYPIVFVEEAEVTGGAAANVETLDPDFIRPDLAENYRRHAFTLDENRPEAVAKRHARGYRMPRVNIAELMDEGSFKEYWPLVVARQHRRHDMETLRKETPADGLLAGTGTINADLFGEQAARAMVVHYDYTVLAGTQGSRNHYKQDRMFELAHRFRIPLVLFGEGGGGRPGDDSIGPGVAFDTNTFTTFSKLSGLVPMVCVINGRTFAGNTALVACCDVIIATENTTVAMGGPAMIEGGGLGIYTPEEVGPMSTQVPNGVVDILVKDEAEAVQVARKYLSYFQGPVQDWQANDQRTLRHVIPENRLRLYDMREIIETIADKDSVLEIREKFGVGVITAFIRVEGRPMGVIANNPHHLAGAIDSDGADKGARFIQLCDAFDIPILSLMDCPGMMVGPDVEKTALVRHCVRMFNAGANLTTPLFGVVVRKAYGLGVQAMCGASALVGFFTVAWPTAEFAGMNIEGSVKLGYRKELAAMEDPEERKREFDTRVARAYEGAKAVNSAPGGGIDDVIDPADTREWIAASLKRLPPVAPRTEKKYPYIDTW
ncbi:MAG: carbamoyl-phosphate synthase large subunit [Proteobacteria bacterium]|jgi:acetyl/propionyl-CoA carboxylase alpha subunit/acetyl-CoA carboxylase carboxyltransferase component|nr:carbamoyl-phosphate synthase large subunit [Pseudomonadota bacterium]MDA1299497.1 carbamoyl-phosphate synthase large subunit [Pseudomonadota bacterium]